MTSRWPWEGQQGQGGVIPNHSTVAILSLTTSTSLLKKWQRLCQADCGIFSEDVWNAFWGHQIGWSSIVVRAMSTKLTLRDTIATFDICTPKYYHGYIARGNRAKSQKVQTLKITKKTLKSSSWKASNQTIRSWSAVRGQTTRFLLLVDISSMEIPHSGPLYIVYHMRCNAIIMLHDSITVIIVTFHLFWPLHIPHKNPF